jgi:hypothetical protein
MLGKSIKIIFLIAFAAASAGSAAAQAAAQVSDNAATLDFPNTITFSATLQSSAQISSIVLEYGTRQSTCGEVIAKGFPEFSPGTRVQVEWTWDMRQAGSLPPGATIWWRWRFVDEAGKETSSEEQTVTWLDEYNDWQTIDGGLLRLHWYGSNEKTAQAILQAGLDGLEFNERESGLKADSPIDLYMYPNYVDMRDAILYEPSWTGGMAFPEHNVVIMGLSESDNRWDRTMVVHELTHVLVGDLTFSCLTIMPTWLNEGLAVYSEGELDPGSADQLEQAIRDDALISVRSLSAGFSEIPDKAYLSYSQSYSIVKFLIETHGQEKMTALLNTLKQGVGVDEALLEVYGFDVEGLEDAWRESVGAAPRAVAAQPTAQPTPTYVPTIVPISGVPIIAGAATAVPTSSFAERTPTEEPGRGYGPPLALTLLLAGTCCVFGLLAGVIILMVIMRSSRNKEAGHEQA